MNAFCLLLIIHTRTSPPPHIPSLAPEGALPTEVPCTGPGRLFMRACGLKAAAELRVSVPIIDLRVAARR